jgi:hypothetical protein
MGWCQAVLTRWAPRHRCRAFFLERDGRFDEITREHAQGACSRLEPSRVRASATLLSPAEDMMKFKTIKLLLKLSYLITVCRHEGVLAVQLPDDLVDDKLKVTTDVKLLDLELAVMHNLLTRDSHSATLFVAQKCS